MAKSRKNFCLEKGAIICFLIPTLLLNITAAPLSEYEARMRFICPETSISSCSCSFVISDFEIQCPAADPQIIIRIQPNTYVQIECTTVEVKEFTLLPVMNIGEISMVQIRRCPLPPRQPIQALHDRLGIRKIRSLLFQSYGVDLGRPLVREHLKGLTELERLVLSGNGLSDLPEDLFADVRNLTWLDLKSNKVHLPPKIFTSLEKLDYLELGYNNLQNLEAGIFHNQKRLKHLNLWGNNLKNLSKYAFEGVSSIMELDLSSNNIETFMPDVFSFLKNLTTLNLSTNNLKTLPEGLFSENKKLNRLRLVDNRVDLPTLPPGLLANLTELEDVRIKCQLKDVPESLFEGSTNLRNISLAANAIEHLPVSLFADQVELLNLDLSRNELRELPEDIFENTRSLLVLSLAHNKLGNISRNIFTSLQELTELYLEGNMLHHIHPNAFAGAKSLQIIDLQNNQLTLRDDTSISPDMIYDFGSPFQNLNELRSLNLRNNSITNIYRDWMFNMGKLENLDLSYNKILMLSHNDLQFLSRKVQVNLTHNLIEEFDFRDVEYLDFDTDPKNVVVYVAFNPIVCNCIILHFVQFLRNDIAQKVKKNLQVIPGDLTCVAPSNLEGRLVTQIHPSELLCPLDSDLSTIKRCPAGCKCFVRPYDRALIVNCSNTGLTKVPLLPRLQSLGLNFTELHIENNSIIKLPQAETPGYADTKEIYANNNNISQLSLHNIPIGLNVLELAGNNLQWLNDSALDALNHTHKVKKLKLSDNPWLCDCNALRFATFLKTNYMKVSDLDGVRCTTGKKLSDVSPGDLCATDQGVVIAVSVLVAIFGLCAGILAALYYKYQQEVKVWLFAHKMCLWFVTEEELDKDKKYDAFISYSHKDEDFITEHLVPELESGPTPFKLCIHVRDWVVGEFIPNQIATSVEDSRRTIVVLSPNFLESVWGRMEFRTAHTAALSEGRARVIVIIYGDIGETDNLEPELKAYLKTNTYVRWDDPWFWNKLRYAMPHPTNKKFPIGLVKNTVKSSTDDKLELIKPVPVTPPLTTPPAEQANKNPLVSNLNGGIKANGKISNGICGHVNGAFIINTNAKQSDV